MAELGSGRARRGQSSVEYALVLLAFVCMLAALAAIWRAASQGRVLEQARSSSAHNAEGDPAALMQDLFAF